MDVSYELIQKADNGDAEAQWLVAWHIVWEDENEPIEPDWLERAVYYFECAAEQGYGDAMLDLGAMYRVGRGVQRDIDKALYWYNKAAAILHPKAFRCLGYALEIPLGYLDAIDENDKEAYKTAFLYFFKGAILGEQNSIYKIGDMFFTGKFVDVDHNSAFDLYQRSYDSIEYIEDDSYASVCLRLGECYYQGIGTEQDFNKARDYIKRAIEGFELRIRRGEAPEFTMGGYNRAKLLLKRAESSRIIEPISIKNANTDDDGYLSFINSDAVKYPEPKYPIVELEVLKAENPKIEQFDDALLFNDELAAAESGDKDSMYHIAFYCHNRYIKKPESRAMLEFSFYYYHKAVQNGCRDAMYNLGAIYDHGTGGMEIDKNKAFLLYFYSKARIAWGELGVFYAMGEVVEKDYEKAFKYFSKYALTREYARYGSLANLAIMYRKGLYVEADEKFADYCDGESKRLEEAWKAEYEKE